MDFLVRIVLYRGTSSVIFDVRRVRGENVESVLIAIHVFINGGSPLHWGYLLN